MLSGTFRDRVKLQKRTVTQTAAGQDEVWSDVAIYWARVVPLGAEARLRYAQLESEVTHEVALRGSEVITVKEHRFIWLTRASRVLEVTAPRADRDGMQRLQVIGVREHE